jgi:hypothetical protein
MKSQKKEEKIELDFLFRRDFRLLIGDPKNPTQPIPHPVVWESITNIIAKNETTDRIVYKAAFLKPISGWLGFYFQFSFAGLESSVLEVSTEANIIPETYPFDDCTLDSCFGKLV